MKAVAPGVASASKSADHRHFDETWNLARNATPIYSAAVTQSRAIELRATA